MKKRISSIAYIPVIVVLFIVALSLINNMTEALESPPDATPVIYTPAYTSLSAEATETKILEPIPAPRLPLITSMQADEMAAIVAAEVGNSSYECQMAIAQVMLDRFNHPNKKLYGGYSLYDVIRREGHFAKPTKYDMALFPTARDAVLDVFVRGKRVFEATTVIYFHPAGTSYSAASTLRRYNYVGTIDGCEFRGDIIG